MGERKTIIESVAIIGAGASGAITAAAFKAENYFERIRVFERRETSGGTWIYDPDPKPSLSIRPGGLPTEIDPPLEIPDHLPQATSPSQQERYTKTPIYDSLTTNVPEIAMSFSDVRFAYGPFVPHYVPRQYIENYFSLHRTDSLLVLNTTVEDVSRIPPSLDDGLERWKLTLRRYDSVRHVDSWWEEVFDALVLANGHYSVPYIPQVKGLEAYIERFSGRVVHSKYYRTPQVYFSKKVIVIGNSASGHDITNELVKYAELPVYQSRKSSSRWDGDHSPSGIEWKPIIKEYKLDGRIVFEDDTYLENVETVIYCTGYSASFPFWNAKANGRPLWDYESRKLIKGYWHTFFQDFQTLGIVGLPRVLTFRGLEYQAIALARLFSQRNLLPLPPLEEQRRWERERLDDSRKTGKKFHDILWEPGETIEWLRLLFEIAGLGTLKGDGRVPPVLGKELIWAVENIKKYPEPDVGHDEKHCHGEGCKDGKEQDGWVLVKRAKKDLLAFI